MNAEPIYVIKANGNREPFDESKLEYSLRRAGASSQAIQQIIAHIKVHLKKNITTHEIYRHAFELLHKEDKPIAIKYSLKRAVMELGPTGFPFEDFVAEIFRARGYEAETGKIVRGFCVEHEVDVVAWNKEKLVMVEAKFHNELGTKSDLKVILYVKARFDDLRQMKFPYGEPPGKERELDEAWLVTNTKFSSTAIEYGSCQGGVVMVGWNYPPMGNLHDMILESKLHPLTCLVSLKGREKKLLLDQGIVLCKTLAENVDLLEAIGLSAEEKQDVLDEIEAL
jgi:hypothetical protein